MMRHAGLRIAKLVLFAFVLSACAVHSTRYYSNDGPPEHVPADLASTPDPVPRVEPVNPYANRPYTAMGRRYTPDTSDEPFEQRGLASWYGRQYHGNRTASGEPYDMFAMSAAHPTLPIPSYARITNVRDGRSVVVRINDRGPFIQDRIIDLSYVAAVRLGIANLGSGEVIVRKITAQDIAAAAQTAPPVAAVGAPVPVAVMPVAPPPVVATLATPAPDPNPVSVTALATPPPVLDASAESSRSQRPPVAAALIAPSDPASVPAPQSGVLVPPPAPERSEGSGSWSVQLGAFSVASNASELRDQVAQRLTAPDADALPAQARTARIEQTGRLSRVLIGRLPDRRSAQALALQLGKLLARETSLYGR